MRSDTQPPMPLEVGRANAQDIRIVWQDRHESIYIARDLRLSCPCAGCVDELTGDRRVAASQVAEDVTPRDLQLVGRYGISIQWSDGHRTGIYAFDRLRAACACATCHPTLTP